MLEFPSMEPYRSITITPLAGACGAEVGGVDLGALDDEVLAGIRRAFLAHLVLVFRDQEITPDEQKAFGRAFGAFEIHPFREPLPDHPEILPIIKEPHERRNVGGGWHTDMTFAEEPPLGTVLYAREVPENRGDTMFTNNYLAYETLSDGMKRLLEGLVAVHCAERVHGPAATEDQSAYRREAARKAEATSLTEHPVLRTHPETGRRALFVNPSFTLRFKDWTEEESRPLLGYLFRHMARAEFVTRVRWRKNTVVFWDNRCTQHFALNDYHGARREMHRLMIKGGRPFLAAEQVGQSDA